MEKYKPPKKAKPLMLIRKPVSPRIIKTDKPKPTMEKRKPIKQNYPKNVNSK